jgi:hypothetical protein
MSRAFPAIRSTARTVSTLRAVATTPRRRSITWLPSFAR